MPAHEQSLRASVAANERWAHEPDRVRATQAARSAFIAGFERRADPEGTLPPEERARRANSLMKAHMQRMSLKSLQARRRNRDASQGRPSEALANQAIAAEAEFREFGSNA